MFILIDTDLQGLAAYREHLNEIDDKPVKGFSALDEYTPGGDFHILDRGYTARGSRWHQLHLATLGARVFSDTFDRDSALYAGPLPEADKIRKVTVDAAMAETRAGHFASLGVNYLGRTKLNPRNIFVLDNKKGNATHDPSKDPTLEALYASLPADWWGTCAFVSSGNPDKLVAFLDEFQGDVIPLAFTTGAFAKLKYAGQEYVEMGVPDGTPAYGIAAREASNRLSYKLSLPDEQAQPEQPQGGSWLQL